jgi:D-amino-acid dehydrogenase
MDREFDVVVLGAGIVGVCIALQLQRNGQRTALLDRRGPGAGASFGNAGLIQSEAVNPQMFPRDIRVLMRYARNRSIDASYHPSALAQFLGPFFDYWRNSTPERMQAIANARAPLILPSTADHQALAEAAGAQHLLRPTGWMQVYRSASALEKAAGDASALRQQFGVPSELLDSSALQGQEPALKSGLAGAIHWTGPLAVSDPQLLTLAYCGLFERLGGRLLRGDARTLRADAGAWQVLSDEGPASAGHAVVALGAWAPEVTRSFGYAPPLFVKRGYHMHFAMEAGRTLRRPLLDAERGYFLAPMQQGLRLTTGAEFAGRDARPTAVQLERAVPVAHALVPCLRGPIDEKPWLGSRPCLPDMLPIIGPAPGVPKLWYSFGHGHQGLTMAATTARLIVAMILGQPLFLDPHPYRAERFAQARSIPTRGTPQENPRSRIPHATDDDQTAYAAGAVRRRRAHHRIAHDQRRR